MPKESRVLGGSMNRHRAKSHSHFLVSSSHVLNIFLMAMRAGRMPELQWGNSAGTDILALVPTASSTSLLTWGRCSLCLRLALQQYSSAQHRFHFYWGAPKRLRPTVLSVTRFAYLTLSQLKSWVKLIVPSLTPSTVMSVIWNQMLHLVPNTTYNIKLQHKEKNAQFYWLWKWKLGIIQLWHCFVQSLWGTKTMTEKWNVHCRISREDSQQLQSVWNSSMTHSGLGKQPYCF